MWRSVSTHEKKDTEFLDAAIKRIEADASLRMKADAILTAMKDEATFRELFSCPQSPNHHAEGPFVEDHLRLTLMAFHAILDGKLHLIDIEEFRRLKGYGGEIDEMEEIVKERAAAVETFLLCHDLGKPEAIWFEARPGSRGEAEGFLRAGVEARSKYRALYDAFASLHKGEAPADLQAAFFLEYQILVHYSGHGKLLARSDLRAAFKQVAGARKLPSSEQADVYHVILKHMDVVDGFGEPNVTRYQHLVDYAAKLGRDVDDFLDLLIACVFLDAVCGSRRGSAHGAWHDAAVVTNFLITEHDFAPWQREERERARAKEWIKAERKRFRDVGLDGDALLQLLTMRPSPEFGRMLLAIQAAARSEGPLPPLPASVVPEIEKRILAFRKQSA
jgi:hypothetical protein